MTEEQFDFQREIFRDAVHRAACDFFARLALRVPPSDIGYVTSCALAGLPVWEDAQSLQRAPGDDE